MNLIKIYKNIFLVMFLGFVLSACATQTSTKKIDSQIQGDVYTGTDTVEYLAAVSYTHLTLPTIYSV